MQISKIEGAINQGLDSLQKSLHEYWPVPNDENELSERNLSTHVAHSFLQKGLLVYAEARFLTNRRLDLLALHEDSKTQVAVECKILPDDTQAKSLAKDVDRVMEFKMMWKDEIQFRPQKRFGVLLAVTWDKAIKNWWECEWSHHSHPKGKKDHGGWDYLGERLKNFKTKTWAKIVFKDPISKKHKQLWALCAICEERK